MSIERILSIISFIIAVVIHECAHGYAALIMGDPTAKNAGRLTLNPIAHVDVIGLISMILFRFGWAKGVPVNPNNFENRRLGNLLVSSAGILTNFIVAFIALNMANLVPINNYYVVLFLINLGLVNVMLGVFNLLPLPPLDGSKIILTFMPEEVEYSVYKYEQYLYIILIFLIGSGYINRILPHLIDKVVGILII